MARIMNLMWKSENGKTFNIGELTSKEEKYYFQYNIEETKKATLEGFSPMEGFPKINVKYFKEELFNTFKSWIENKHSNDVNDLEELKQISINGFTFENEEFVNKSPLF